MEMKEYYHITPIKNKDSIIQSGLKLGTKDKYGSFKTTGKIFLFEDVDIPYPEGFFRKGKWNNNLRLIPVSDIIAKNELIISEYSLFKVKTDAQIFPDKCGEGSVQNYQHYITEPIPAEQVEWLGDFEVGKWFEYELLKEKYHIPNGCKVVQGFGGENFEVPVGTKNIYEYALSS